MGSTNCSGFAKYFCRFRKIAIFRSGFERYSVLGICLWNPKQQRRSKKSNKIADSTTNLILACCGIRLHCTEFTVWPCNANLKAQIEVFSSLIKKLSAAQTLKTSFAPNGQENQNKLGKRRIRVSE